MRLALAFLMFAACTTLQPLAPQHDSPPVAVAADGTLSLDCSKGDCNGAPAPLAQLQRMVQGVVPPVQELAEGVNTSIDYQERWVKGALILGSTYSSANKLTRILGASSTIDFASTTVGKLDSSGITVTGAKAGDPCFVGPPAAAGALQADFTCYVSAADTVKVVFMPVSIQQGTIALTSASPSTATVNSITAGSSCQCSPIGTTAAIAAGGCAANLASTTLTLTGPNTVTTTVFWQCTAAVDPASGTFYVWVASNQ